MTIEAIKQFDKVLTKMELEAKEAESNYYTKFLLTKGRIQRFKELAKEYEGYDHEILNQKGTKFLIAKKLNEALVGKVTNMVSPPKAASKCLSKTKTVYGYKPVNVPHPFKRIGQNRFHNTEDKRLSPDNKPYVYTNYNGVYTEKKLYKALDIINARTALDKPTTHKMLCKIEGVTMKNASSVTLILRRRGWVRSASKADEFGIRVVPAEFYAVKRS